MAHVMSTKMSLINFCNSNCMVRPVLFRKCWPLLAMIFSVHCLSVVAARQLNDVRAPAAGLLTTSGSPATTSMSSNSGRTTRSRPSMIRAGVSHIWDAHSPLRPAGCDDACASRLRLKRYAEARAVRQKKNTRAAVEPSTANGTSSTPFYRHDQERQLDAIPWGQVGTGYFSGGQFSEYYMTLSVSDAAQALLLLLDTGSDLPWFQCQPCESCYPQSFAIYDPHISGTHYMTNTNDPYCADVQAVPGLGQGADDSLCLYNIGYEDGTNSYGYIATEEFSFWDSGPGSDEEVTVTISDLGFGCGTRNAAGVQTVASGVLGLGFGRGLSFPEQLNVLHDYSTAFAFCLAPIFSSPNSGWLTFGDGALAPADYPSTPLVTDQGALVYHYVEAVDFLIDGQRVGVPDGVLSTINDDEEATGGVIVDTGDMLTIITSDAYAPFRAAWLDAVAPILGDPGAPGPEGLDACWDYPNDASGLPTIAFLFANGNALTLAPGATQLVFTDDNGVRRMCWPFVEKRDGDTSANMVIGAVSLHSTEIVIDADNSIFAWNPTYQC